MTHLPQPGATLLLASYRLLTAGAGGFARLARGWARFRSRPDDFEHLGQRLALPPHLDELPRGGIWLHGASVGEVRSLRPLVDALKRQDPATPLFLTTSSTTGRQCARDVLGLPATLAPWDAGGPLTRFLSTTRPHLHVIVETEIWPARLAALERLRIPAALVSARLSPEAWPRYRRLRSLYAPALARLTLLAPSGPADRERFLKLGVSPAELGPEGSLKWDVKPEAASTGDLDAIRDELGLTRERPWIVFGSMHPGESVPILEPLRNAGEGVLPCGVIIAPRHPQRFDEIAQELERAAFAVHRSSAGPANRQTRVLLLDSMGLLARLYPLAAASVLGGSFARIGGHSPLEAAAAACPIVSGPHVFHQQVLTEPLERAGGLVIADSPQRAADLLWRWLKTPGVRQRAGQSARAEFLSRAGLGERLATALIPLLESGS